MQKKNLLINKKPAGIKVEVASSFIHRLKGWMFKNDVPETGLLIYPCNGIHTFFVRFHIDVFFLDSRNRVVKSILNLPPCRIVPVVFNAVNVLELPAGIGKYLKIKIGDHLIVE